MPFQKGKANLRNFEVTKINQLYALALLNAMHSGFGLFYSMHDQIFPRFFIKAKPQTNKLTRSASYCTLKSIIPHIPFATSWVRESHIIVILFLSKLPP
jgi:hypothetical protein